MKKIFLFLVGLFFLAGSLSAATMTLVSMKGKVEVRTLTGQTIAGEVGLIVSEGEQIVTGANGQAEIRYPNGSISGIGANAKVTVEKCGEENTITLLIGKVQALVKKLKPGQKFEIKTPTAVCSVRGTKFTVEVDEDFKTRISVFEGLVAARQIKGIGEEVLVHPQERIEILENMPAGSPEKQEGSLRQQQSIQSAEAKQEVQKEVALNMSQEEVQAAAAGELKLAEYQEGKSVVDAFGKRVRLEEYIIRPQADQFKLVVLNTREDRFDYFYWLATFDKTLPVDLRQATRYMYGKSGDDRPEFQLLADEQYFSNTIDYIVSKYSGGHSVENLDGDGWVTKFDQFEYKIYDTEKFGYTRVDDLWTPKGDYYYDNVTWRVLGEEKTYDQVASLLTKSYPDGSDVWHESYKAKFDKDGSWYQEDYYWINDDGKVATIKEFTNLRDLSKWNQELVLTASEFEGRKIDLIISPKVYIESQIIDLE
ncbi:MAG: FecR domain-containing protein [Elusimicrobiota bacterium]